MTLRKENILIVDDNYDMLELLHRNLKALQFHTYKASSVTEAIEILKDSTPDLIITDLQMPGINGIELIRYAKEHFPEVPTLVITGFPSVGTAVDAVKSGALDYLTKPFTAEELRIAVGQALQTKTPDLKNKKTPVRQHYAGMSGQSQQFETLVETIERVKNNKATVLIQGESGTGKELIARAIHYNGAFSQNPFIAVNCGAIPEHLMESELFGYVKGAFTGANEDRMGFFQAANGGTVFLDEIGTAPLNIQTRLLRVLQEKEIVRIGSQQVHKIDVRIISATNSDLFDMVKAGTFRQDLYYRLNVVNIETPPLRLRKDDIEPLVSTFLKKYSAEYNKPGITISAESMKMLQRYDWPGNIRELENVIQRMIIMNSDNTAAAVPSYLKYAEPLIAGPLLSLKEAEKVHILKVLAAVGDNKTKAAEILGIDRKTLRQKIGS